MLCEVRNNHKGRQTGTNSSTTKSLAYMVQDIESYVVDILNMQAVYENVWCLR